MSDEVKVRVSADGATSTAAQLDKLTAALEKQRKTQEMLAKTSDSIQRQANIDALKKEASAVNDVTAVLQRHQQAIANTNGAVAEFGTNTQQLRSKLSPAAALIGNLSNSFATLVPETGGATKALQTAGMAASQMLGVLGGGPGILIGGLVAGVGALASIMAESTKEADDLTRATEANAKAAGDWLQQIQQARGLASQRVSGLASEADLQRRLREGDATSQEFQTELATKREMINKRYSIEALTAARASGGQAAVEALLDAQTQESKQLDVLTEKYASAASAAQQLADAQNQNALSLARINGAAQEIPDNKPPPKVLPKISDSNAYMMEQIGSVSTADQVMFDQRGVDKSLVDEQKRREDSFRFEIGQYNQHIADMKKIDEDAAAEKLKLEARVQAETDKIGQMEVSARSAAVQMMTGTTLKGISEVLKGKKLEAGAIMEGLGDQFVAAGTGLVFTGLGISANPLTPGAGAGMVTIGTAEVAFGLGLGAAGARMPGGSNSGGGAESKSTANAFSPRDYGDPYSKSFTPSQPTIININMPTVLSPSPEDGKRVVEAIKSAQNVYGTTL